MKRLLALMLMLLMVICCFAACDGPDVEEIDWINIRLGNVLPEPQSSMIEIFSNSDDYLSIYIHEMSENDYFEYVRWCEDDKGFSIDRENYSSSFSAYNSEGYFLDIYYNEYEDTMHICLEVPIELTEYVFPDYAVMAGLPYPDSTQGNYRWRSDDKFFLYVGATTREEFLDYIDKCVAAGFTIDPYEYGNGYSAENIDGFKVNLDFEGFNMFTIEFSSPSDDKTPDENPTENSSTDILIALPRSDYEYLWENYQDIIDEFVECGFTNVQAVPLGDMTGDEWLTSEGDCDTITIDGKESFDEGDLYPANVEIIITYHSYSVNSNIDPTETALITVTMDEDELKGLHYTEAEQFLREMGFTVFEYDVIETEDQEISDGTVAAVEIKKWAFGNGDFAKGDSYETDAIVVLWYYECEEVIIIPNLSAENCPDLANLLELCDPCDPSVAAFASLYSGQTIEFDGCIAAMQNHGDYKTRYDLLIGAGDYDPNSLRGPNFHVTNVNYYDMNVTGGDSVFVGLNVHIVARVGEYNAYTSLFEIEIISIEIR